MKLEMAAAGDERSSALVVLSETALSAQAAAQWVSLMREHYSIYTLAGELPAAEEVADFSAALCRYCNHRRLRRITVIGLGSGASVAMALTVSSEKLVRRLVIVDGASRLKPGVFTKALDAVEESLPLGFPLRTLSKAYDARSELHRIHCPALVVTSPAASQYIMLQSDLIASRIPNSWSVGFSGEFVNARGEISAEAAKLLLEFGQVPVKRPQKAG